MNKMVNNYYSWLENKEAYFQIFVAKIYAACNHDLFLYTVLQLAIFFSSLVLFIYVKILFCL